MMTLGGFIISIVFLTASLPSRPDYDGRHYRIYVDKSDTNVKYKVNDFYSVYYVYMNVIRALDINEELSDHEIEKIICIIIDNLKKRKIVQLQIDNHRGTGTLRVTLRPEIAPKKGKAILWIVSNYNANAKQVVTGEAEKDAYATFFYLEGDKLVKYQYVSQPKSDADLKKLSVNNLADYYLLDGDPANDKLGFNLLLKEIEKMGDVPDRALLYMTLSEYYLLSQRVERAKECLDKAEAIIRGLNDNKRKSAFSNVLQYCNDLYTYYVKYTTQ